jgi:hypothetical protein
MGWGELRCGIQLGTVHVFGEVVGLRIEILERSARVRKPRGPNYGSTQPIVVGGLVVVLGCDVAR